MADYLPSPLDVEAIWGKNPKTGDEISRKPDVSEPMAGLAFKIATDPFVGKLIFVRVYSGTLKAGSYVLNTTTGEKERVGRIVRMHADKREEIDSISAGDIAAVVGLKSTFTGHTLCAVENPIALANTFVEPPGIGANTVSVFIKPCAASFNVPSPASTKTMSSFFSAQALAISIACPRFFFNFHRASSFINDFTDFFLRNNRYNFSFLLFRWC